MPANEVFPMRSGVVSCRKVAAVEGVADLKGGSLHQRSPERV